jgi:prepilin-type N-terminal cleavage/methylation domain-containing protein/prepilin-type processing-associated H-X9-DG protein
VKLFGDNPRNSPSDPRTRRQRRLKCRRAFTLLELLVVIAILALLAAWLLPSLARTRQLARSVHCLSNVRQWGVGIALYAEDQEGYFPYEGHFLAPINAGLNLEAWYNVLSRYVGRPAMMELYGADHPPLPHDRSLFTCPSVFKAPKSRPTITNPFFMYGFNNRLDPNGPSRFRRFQVVKPSQTVVFTENSERRYPSASGRFTAGRHDGRANLAFVDGHVEGVHSNDYFRQPEEDAKSRVEWSKTREVYWYPFAGAPQ